MTTGHSHYNIQPVLRDFRSIAMIQLNFLNDRFENLYRLYDDLKSAVSTLTIEIVNLENQIAYVRKRQIGFRDTQYKAKEMDGWIEEKAKKNIQIDNLNSKIHQVEKEILDLFISLKATESLLPDGDCVMHHKATHDNNPRNFFR